MTWFKQLFPSLLVPVILLGVGCSQISQVEIPAVIEEEPEVVTMEAAPTEVTFENGSYILTPEGSSIAWSAKKRVGATHVGTVGTQEGSFVVEQGQIVGGSVVADMSAIINTDLTDEKLNTMLINHLKSDDFFGVETYPTATFAIADVAVLAGDASANYTVTGGMTIKGIEQEISFPALFAITDIGVQITGTATLDRTLWDVRYGSDKFFDNLGDGLIEDEFTFTFDLLFTAGE
jgi:polyisoprenoid-binding protein YceI